MAWSLFQRDLRQIGPYEILGRVGKGSAGSVYRARHSQTGRQVAIKVLCTEEAQDPVSLQRFEQEFLATRLLDDPHIVAALDFGHDGNVPYLVMEYVEGESLYEHLKAHGRLTEQEGIGIAFQVAQALQHAHERGIIHRDVKPGNILLATDGQARLADFGLVKWQERGLNLTATATCLGTPCFMAPEQFGDSKRVDLSCDVYGLAATLYMTITGEIPFKANTYAGTIRKKLSGEIAPPRELVPTLSPRVDWAILRGLSVNPPMRQASCAEFVRELTGSDLLGVQDPALPADHPERDRTGTTLASQDRRLALRYPCRLGSVCSALDGKGMKFWETEVRNISVNGLGLVLGRRFEPGTLLVVGTQQRPLDVPGLLMARVVRLETPVPGQWLLGCELAQPLGNEEVRALLQPLAQGAFQAKAGR